MAGFLYFRPGHLTPITRELIALWQLGYAFPGPVACGTCLANTPTQTPGSVFADPERLGERGVLMDMPNQVWRKLPGGETYVGYWKESPPTPADLVRSPVIPGYTVRLANDEPWIIPLVRRFDRTLLKTVSELPCYMECDDHGNFHRGPVMEIHAHLWDLTTPIADALMTLYLEGGLPFVEDPALFKAAVGLLSANYVVGPAELSQMRVFTTEEKTHAAVMTACDWPTFLAWSEEQKKTTPTGTGETPAQPAGSTLSAGDPD